MGLAVILVVAVGVKFVRVVVEIRVVVVLTVEVVVALLVVVVVLVVVIVVMVMVEVILVLFVVVVVIVVLMGVVLVEVVVVLLVVDIRRLIKCVQKISETTGKISAHPAINTGNKSPNSCKAPFPTPSHSWHPAEGRAAGEEVVARGEEGCLKSDDVEVAEAVTDKGALREMCFTLGM